MPNEIVRQAVMGYPAAVVVLVLILGILGLNGLIRRGLTAPRIIGESTPQGLPWVEVRIPTRRKRQLFGWFIPADAGAPTLVVLHGWGANAEMMLPFAGPLHAAGYALLFFDARCHGRSDADTFASLPRFAEDLECAVAWLGLRPEVDPFRIGVIGHSVGAGAALLAASRTAEIAAVVSLAAFAHPASMMRRWLAWKHIPYWPLGAYILFYVQMTIGHRFDRIAPVNTIRRVHCPVLLVHGTEDVTVPVDDAQQIFAGRSGNHVRLLLMPGSHDEYGDLHQSIETVIGFLNGALQHRPTG